MAKKPSLAAAVSKAAGKSVTGEDAKEVVEKQVPIVPPKPPSRQNTKMVGGYFDPAVSKQVKQLAIDYDTTVQDIVREALNDFFQKHDKPPIA